MKKPIFFICLLTGLAWVVGAQDAPDYIAQYTFAAGGKITIQNTTTSQSAEIIAAFYQCDAAATVTQSRDGTAATATTLTPVSLGGGTAPSQTAWSDSNAGAGTTINVFSCAAGEKGTITKPGVRLLARTTATNYSLAVSAGTGKLGISWKQR